MNNIIIDHKKCSNRSFGQADTQLHHHREQFYNIIAINMPDISAMDSRPKAEEYDFVTGTLHAYKTEVRPYDLAYVHAMINRPLSLP